MRIGTCIVWRPAVSEWGWTLTAAAHRLGLDMIPTWVAPVEVVESGYVSEASEDMNHEASPNRMVALVEKGSVSEASGDMN